MDNYRRLMFDSFEIVMICEYEGIILKVSSEIKKIAEKGVFITRRDFNNKPAMLLSELKALVVNHALVNDFSIDSFINILVAIVVKNDILDSYEAMQFMRDAKALLSAHQNKIDKYMKINEKTIEEVRSFNEKISALEEKIIELKRERTDSVDGLIYLEVE